MIADYFLTTPLFLIALLSVLTALFLSYQQAEKFVSDLQRISVSSTNIYPNRAISLVWLKDSLQRYWPESVIAGVLFVTTIAIWISLPDPLALESLQSKQVGRPFDSLRVVYQLQLQTMPWWKYIVAFVCSSLSFGLMIASLIAHYRKKESLVFARSSILVAALGLANLGQLELLGYFEGSGLWLYISALFLFIVWVSLAYPNTIEIFNDASWPPLKEAAFLLAACLLTIFVRFYAIGAVPYGIEGDESKWSVEVISAMRDNSYPHSTAYHIGAVPLSFWMQAPFLIAVGPTVFAGRVAVATYSVLGSLSCYWFVRQILGQRAALLSMILLSVSLLDTSASRLANVESHVKLWPPLALALLARAINNKSLLSYLLAGVATGLGFLTYETVTPLGGVIVVIMAIEWWRERPSFEAVVRRLIAFFIPLCFVLPITLTYLYGRLGYYEFEEKAAIHGFWEGIWNQVIDLGSAVFVQAKGDFLYNRNGPLLHSFLLPWLVFGIVLTILTWKRSRLFWILIWAFFFFVPTPILAHMPAGRVFYPGLPAVYILIASALLAVYTSLRSSGFNYLSSLTKGFSSVALGLFIIQSLYISFNEVHDFNDRIYRRELYDLAQTHAGDDHLMLYPYVIAANDPIEQEGEQLIRLGMRRPEGGSYPFSLVELNELLPQIAAADPSTRVSVVWDTISPIKRIEREQVLGALLDCYPETEVQLGLAFDTYTLSREAIKHARCTSGTISLEAKQTTNKQEYILDWSIEAPQSVEELILSCEASYPETILIPAESLNGPGWRIETAFALDFEGEGFLEDLQTHEPATLRLQGLPTKPHYIWVRSYRRQVDDFPGLIALNGEVEAFSKQDAPLEMWFWERLGPFDLQVSDPLISIMRPSSKDIASFRALFIDSLILTTSPDFDPNIDSIWMTHFQHTIQLETGQIHGTLPVNLPKEFYRCRISVPEDSALIDGTGSKPLQSPAIVFYQHDYKH